MFHSSEAVSPRHRLEEHAWAVVLAGGEGFRLRDLTRHVHGEDRPKQYAVLTGRSSLLRQTLDRVGLGLPAARTLILTMAGQGHYMAVELRHLGPAAPHGLEQPADRGTAAAILLAAHWIRARDPEASMVVLPSDHYVADDVRFMQRVGDAIRAVGRRPDQIVLLGVEPTEPETDYGWIELGDRLPDTGDAEPLYRVARFVEKPAQTTADVLFDKGALWNTFIFAGRAATVIGAGRECVPDLHGRLARVVRFLGTAHQSWAVALAYDSAPRAGFSRDVLERCADRLVAMRLSHVSWRDLGTSRRVIATLGELGIRPAWLATL